MVTSTLQSLLSICFLADSQIPPPSIWVPIALGVVVVIYCLARRDKLPAEIQKVAWGSLKLEISVFTAAFLLGVLLALSGVGIYVFTSVTEVSDLEKKLAGAQQAAQEAQHFGLVLHVIPPADFDPKKADLSKLKCRYKLARGGGDEVYATWGTSDRDLQCSLMDITRVDVIQNLQLFDIGTGIVLGRARDIYPLQPIVPLESAK